MRVLLAWLGLIGLALAAVPVTRMDDVRYWFPWEVRLGPIHFAQLETVGDIQDGTRTFCDDCLDGSDPCQLAFGDPKGAFAERLKNGSGARWRCGAAFDCAGVLACTPACIGLGQGCTETSQCCAGSCINNICSLGGCVAQIGDPCMETQQCCQGVCIDDFCVGATACTPLGDPCTVTGECCSGFCSGGVCSSPSGCLGGLGHVCTGSGDCCVGFCASGLCTAPACTAALGDACSSTMDCCVGSCNAGICTAGGCVAGGLTCALATDCCSGICAQGYCASGQECHTLDPALTVDTHYEYWPAPTPTRLLDVMCYCQGTCGGSELLDFSDTAGNQINVGGASAPHVLCDEGASPTEHLYTPFSTSDADRIMLEGRGLRLEPFSLSLGVDKVYWCVRWAPFR